MQGMNRVNEIYHELLDLGVAKEQARILLPLNQYTEVYWTASFQAVANLIELRDHDHAQLEIREFAKAIATITQEQFPHAYKAWFNRKGV
jgi:thymidylate synthase (FAD)